jgi:hypothetical protein
VTSSEILHGKKLNFFCHLQSKARSMTALLPHTTTKNFYFSIWSRPHSGKERCHQLGVGRVVTCNHPVYAGRNDPSKIQNFGEKKFKTFFLVRKSKNLLVTFLKKKTREMLELNEVEKKLFSFKDFSWK